MDIAFELNAFVKPCRLGTLVGSDSGILLAREPDTIREPDSAFTPAGGLRLGEATAGYAEVVPDLVVEVASPPAPGGIVTGLITQHRAGRRQEAVGHRAQRP